jgi:hypothetical protein
MPRSTTLFAVLLLGILAAPAASAESFPPQNSLTPTEQLSRDLFAHHCIVAAADNECVG